MALEIATTLSCAPGAELGGAERSSQRDVELRGQSAAAAAAPVPPAHPANPSSFTLFESGQVRPLALSPDGRHLFAVNTPDSRLEMFRIERHRLVHTGSVPVGLEPVAVAARSDRDPSRSTRCSIR